MAQTLCKQNHWVAAGKRQYSEGMGIPVGVEVGSVELLERASRQGLASERAEIVNTESECKRGLLVVKATVKGFEKPWIV